VRHIGENHLRAQAPITKPRSRTKPRGPLTHVGKVLQAAVDSGYGIKIEISPPATPEAAVTSVLEEWKARRARQA